MTNSSNTSAWQGTPRAHDSLEDSANLEDPDVIAAEIVEDLRAALEEFELILGDLSAGA